jgi:hypothetical protein
MATAHMPDEFFDAVAHHLPPEQPVGPKKLSENGWNTLCVKEVVARHLITAHRNRSPSHDPPQARTQAAGHDLGDPR